MSYKIEIRNRRPAGHGWVWFLRRQDDSLVVNGQQLTENIAREAAECALRFEIERDRLAAARRGS